MATPDPSRRILPDDWQLVAPLLDQLLDVAPERRHALLAELSGGDPTRRAELEALVAECDRADPLLDRPAAEGFSALFEDEVVRVPEVLGDRYRIVKQLARGGMATVFLARDVKHGRDVAVKVVRPELAAALGRTRFRREIEIAAQLRHPHIVPLFDSGEAGEILYYVMPFEPGASLRERLAERGPLSIDDAVRILQDVCGALAHAHQHGIVHRDIKPENVLLSERHAMVTDFGVAKAVRDATRREAATTAGVTLGTPAYMSPEQITADSHVDHRADIYAVGVLGYELLTGRPPFEGETTQEVLGAHLALAPQPLSIRRPDVPPPLGDLIMKCLEKRPADRWQQADDLLARLDALPTPSAGQPPVAVRRLRWTPRARAAAGAVILAALGIAAWQVTRAGHEVESGSVAIPAGTTGVAPSGQEFFIVADFDNLTSDSTLGTLLAQVLRDELAGSPQLAYVGPERISATKRRMRLEPNASLTPAVAREIAVRDRIKMVVEGGIRPAGTGFVLVARFVEAASGDVIHGATATARDSAEILAAIGRLSHSLRQGVGESLKSIQAMGRTLSVTTSSLPALQKFNASVTARSGGDYLQAMTFAKDAVALDPDFAIAYANLASNRWRAGLPRGPVIPGIVRAYALRDSLTALDRSAVAAFYHQEVTGDLSRSIAEFRSLLEATQQLHEPGFMSDFAYALVLNGDLTAAKAVIEEANSAVGYKSRSNQLALVQILHALGREAEAGRVLDELIQSGPENPAAIRLRVGFLADSGRYEAAHTLAASIRRGASLLNDLRMQAELDAMRGRYAESIQHLRDLRDQALALGELGAAVEIAAAAGRLRLLSGDAAGVSEVDTLIARVDSLDVLSRPYLPLVLFYASAGRAGGARTWLNRYEREFPVRFRGPDRWMLHRARAAVHRVQGDQKGALAELQQAARVPGLRVGLFDEPHIRSSDSPELARVYRQLGAADSALRVYERYFAVRWLSRTTVDAFERGQALEALAGLYDQRGDRARAAASYRAFAELWHDADPPLQPRVQAALRRAATLAR